MSDGILLRDNCSAGNQREMPYRQNARDHQRRGGVDDRTERDSRAVWCIRWFAGVPYAKDDAKRRIANMSGEWIPVTERLPEPGLDVLIFFRATDEDGTPSCIGCDGNGGLITIAAMDRIDGQHLWTSEYGDDTPTHWMPLPAPPTDAK